MIFLKFYKSHFYNYYILYSLKVFCDLCKVHDLLPFLEYHCCNMFLCNVFRSWKVITFFWFTFTSFLHAPNKNVQWFLIILYIFLSIIFLKLLNCLKEKKIIHFCLSKTFLNSLTFPGFWDNAAILVYP